MKRSDKQSFWREHVARLKLSGLSCAKYCRKNNLKSSVFQYWIKKFVSARSSSAASSFMPVQIKSSPIGPGSDIASGNLLCALEVRGGVVKIYDPLVLSFVLDRVL